MSTFLRKLGLGIYVGVSNAIMLYENKDNYSYYNEYEKQCKPHVSLPSIQ